MGAGDISLGRNPCDGLASRLGGGSNTLTLASYYANRYKLRPFGSLAGVRLYLFLYISNRLCAILWCSVNRQSDR